MRCLSSALLPHAGCDDRGRGQLCRWLPSPCCSPGCLLCTSSGELGKARPLAWGTPCKNKAYENQVGCLQEGQCRHPSGHLCSLESSKGNLPTLPFRGPRSLQTLLVLPARDEKTRRAGGRAGPGAGASGSSRASNSNHPDPSMNPNLLTLTAQTREASQTSTCT